MPAPQDEGVTFGGGRQVQTAVSHPRMSVLICSRKWQLRLFLGASSLPAVSWLTLREEGRSAGERLCLTVCQAQPRSLSFALSRVIQSSPLSNAVLFFLFYRQGSGEVRVLAALFRSPSQ